MFHTCSLLFCRINLRLNPSDANPHNQTPRTSLSRGHGMGSSVGGDCVLVLANREPNEAPSDLVWANQRWAKSPIDNSVRVPGPCADSTLRATGRQGHGTCRENRQLEADFIGLTSSDDLKAICEKGLTVTLNHIFKMRQRCGVEGTSSSQVRTRPFSFALCQRSSLLFWLFSMTAWEMKKRAGRLCDPSRKKMRVRGRVFAR